MPRWKVLLRLRRSPKPDPLGTAFAPLYTPVALVPRLEEQIVVSRYIPVKIVLFWLTPYLQKDAPGWLAGVHVHNLDIQMQRNPWLSITDLAPN